MYESRRTEVIERPAACPFCKGKVIDTLAKVITVSDGVAQASLPPFTITVQAVATGSALLTWIPPTQNTDGTSLTNLAGYKFYWGPALGNYPSSHTEMNAGLTSFVVEDLAPGTYFFVVTALNSALVESQFSNVATKTVLP